MNSNHVSQLGGNQVGNAVGGQAGVQNQGMGGQPVQQQQQQQQYSMPGVLHYLQYEWQRFEQERQTWDIEKAELNARIALLQGERKGQENLKNDLVRRIKMLEYCLRQERAKYHKLKYGVDPPPSTMGAGDELQQLNSDPLLDEGDGSSTMGSSMSWKHGRHLLRQYLQEIGYTDTIIDVRSNRVRSLLGLNNNATGPLDESANDNTAMRQQNSFQQNQQQPGPQTGRPPPIQAQRRVPSAAADIVADGQQSMFAAFEILEDQPGSERNGDEVDDDDDNEMDDENMVETGGAGYPIDTEVENVIAEFDFLKGEKEWRKDVVDIGELAGLSVTNESDMNGTGNTALQNQLNDEVRRTWNARYILKSHFDCVRSLRFHATEAVLVTASEDETLKLWNLTKTQPQSNKGKQQAPSSGTTFDLEPVYTYRGHTSKVLSLEVNRNQIYSGAMNGELLVWNIPANIANIDPYEPYDPSLAVSNLTGHTDAIWSLALLTGATTPYLCSASSDLSIKIWDLNRFACVKTITWTNEHDGRPTCLAAIGPDSATEVPSMANSSALVCASFSNGIISVYDIEAVASASSESVKPILSFEKNNSRVNAIVVHPTMPVVVSAHEDRHIKFWDLKSGKCINAMVAHLDEVTSLACDPNGLYLLSGSHDCSVRLWNFESRTCVQEITSHRKKFDEAIFDVTFHPSRPYFATAGADGLAKVFV